MCRADGMVFDDGVTSRLADDRFHMTTTTGNAAAGPRPPRGVAPDRVARPARPRHLVTEQWATVAVVGPRARDVLGRARPGPRRLGGGVPVHDLARGRRRGPARPRVPDLVLRASWRIEINVPTWHGLAMWEAVMAAGEPLRHHAVRHGGDARPARREGLPDHRPGDRRDGHAAGPGHGLGRLEDEVVHRLRVRTAGRTNLRPDRKQLVGVAARRPGSADPGGHPARRRRTPIWRRTPVPMIGHVTSSYRSAALGRTFALALVRGGRERHGEIVRAPLDRRDDDRGNDRRPGRVRSRRTCAATASRRRRVTAHEAAAARRSPLAGVALPAGLRELPFLAQLDLRARPVRPAPPGPAIESVVGAAADRAEHGPRRSATSAVLWLGPDEWLVVGAPARSRRLERRLRARPRRRPAGRSPRSSMSRPTGRRSSCATRMRARSWAAAARSISTRARSAPGAAPRRSWPAPASSCGRRPPSRHPTFRLLVRPSFAAYLAAWLTDAIGVVAISLLRSASPVEAVPRDERRRLGPPLQVELGQDRADVVLHRLVGQEDLAPRSPCSSCPRPRAAGSCAPAASARPARRGSRRSRSGGRAGGPAR